MTDIWICLLELFFRQNWKTIKLSWLKMIPNAYKTVLLKCYSCIKIDCRLRTLKIINDEITESCVEKYNLFPSILISIHMFNKLFRLDVTHSSHVTAQNNFWLPDKSSQNIHTHALTTYWLTFKNVNSLLPGTTSKGKQPSKYYRLSFDETWPFLIAIK